MGECIEVFTKFRPPKKKGELISHVSYPSGSSVAVAYGSDTSEMTFDGFRQVITPESTQADVFEAIGLPIIDSVMKGFSASIIAYGQTASGKTYTMIGDPTVTYESNNLDDEAGLIPRVVDELFHRIRKHEALAGAPGSLVFDVRASMTELYIEQFFDLLMPGGGSTKIKLREDKVENNFYTESTEFPVGGSEEVMNLISLGFANRKTAKTKFNTESSRSHAIVMLKVRSEDTVRGVKTFRTLYLVDLAGSEKLAKTEAEGMRLREAKQINKSLLTLGNVISALSAGKGRASEGHIPYRDSQLTKLLKSSLGGSSKCCMLINCSSDVDDVSETIMSLRFGSRVCNVVNTPAVFQERSVAALRDALAVEENKIKSCSNECWQLESRIQRLREIARNTLKAYPPNCPTIEKALQMFPKLKHLQRLAPQKFGYLPVHLVEYVILPFCDIMSLGRMGLVCLEWRDLLQSESLWKDFVHRDAKHEAGLAACVSHPPIPPQTYRAVYIKVMLDRWLILRAEMDSKFKAALEVKNFGRHGVGLRRS